MGEQALTDPVKLEPMLGESRRRVLDMLRVAAGPVGVQEVAQHIGLHPNTARFHLDGLADTGLAERHTEGRGQPGRPRTVYLATAEETPAGQRSYRLLAEMLTSLVSDALPEPSPAAVAAGEAWGRYLAERPAPSHRVDTADGIRRLSTVLAEAGFAPEAPIGESNQPVVPLRHCPFREIAEEHRDVVCSLHFGLIQGVLSEVRAPLAADRLEPFVEPSLCLAHLTPIPRRPSDTSTAGPRRGRRARQSR